MTKDQLITLVFKAIPHPEYVTALDTSEEGAVRFTWQDVRFRVTTDLFVEKVDGAFLHGGVDADLMEALLKSKKS